MRQGLRWVWQHGDGLGVGFLVGTLSLHGLHSLSQGAWPQALMDGAMSLFVFMGYRLLCRMIARPITFVVAAPAQVPVTTCRFERCGEVWVLRALKTHKRLCLAEGDLLRVVISPPGDEDPEDDN